MQNLTACIIASRRVQSEEAVIMRYFLPLIDRRYLFRDARRSQASRGSPYMSQLRGGEPGRMVKW